MQAFRKWTATVRSIKFIRRQRILSDTLLILSPTFGKALLNVRRMSLSATEDTSGDWKRRQGPGGRAMWVEARPSLQQQPAAAEQLPKEEPQTSESGQATDRDHGVSESGSKASGDAPTVMSEEPAATSAVPPAQPASHDTAQLPLPGAHLGMPGEQLPVEGVPKQLGRIGGYVDLYTVAAFRKQRDECRQSVQLSLQQMLQYIVQQVQTVGQAVHEELVAASEAVAKPTRKQAREKRFEAPGNVL